MKDIDEAPEGLGKLGRASLSKILRETEVTVSVLEASVILGVSRQKAGKLLAGYAKKGWLSRIAAGVYIPVPIESESADIVPEDPIVIAEKLFSPCYIAGWSAAEYWGMTEQIFQSVVVMIQREQRNYQPVIKGTEYLLYLTKPFFFYGLKTVWRSNVKVHISDPSRTVLDLMCTPSLGGGIQATVDILKVYFNSGEKSTELLIQYFEKRKNGAAYKRFGFLVEKYFPENEALLQVCRERMTTGNAKLDPSLECDKLATKWRLWVPASWK